MSLRGWLTKWRGHGPDSIIGDADWHDTLAGLPGLAWLSPAQRLRLRSRADEILLRKPIECVAGFELEAAMRLRLAALAALPVMHLDLGWYRNFYTFLVYPDDFMVDREIVDDVGVVHQVREPLAGETAQQGAIILAWTAVAQSGQGEGFNVVAHELAHKLDMLGSGEGVPPLPSSIRSEAWERDFASLRIQLTESADSPLDAYAATDPAECFAVCSEYFFDAPTVLRQHASEVYAHLVRFYRVDPAAGQMA